MAPRRLKNPLKIWLVAAEVPAMVGGAPIRNYNLALQYAKAGHAVTIFCITEPGQKAHIRHLREQAGIQVVTTPLPTQGKVSELLAGIAYRVLPFMRQHRRSGLAQKLLAKAQTFGAPDIVQLEQVNGYYAAEPALNYLRSQGSRIVLDAHNVEQRALAAALEVFDIPKKIIGHYILPHYRRLENKYARQADAVLACSEEDRQYFQKYNDTTLVAANGVDLTYFKALPDTNEPVLLFTGGTSYPPNEDALRWYTNDIHPLVKQKFPDMKFYIVGSKPPEWLVEAAKADDSIIPLGFVDDVRVYQKKAAICISPMRKGSGTSLKILAYSASAKPIVSTAVGVRGINCKPGRDLVIADTPKSFASAITRLLADSDERQRLGSNAREMVKQRYSWPKIGAVACNLLTSLAQDSSSKSQNQKRARITARQALLASMLWLHIALVMITGHVEPALLRGLVVLPLFVLGPGWLLLGIVRARTQSTLHRFFYSVALSLAYWILGGLLYNNFEFWIGYRQPLAEWPVMMWFYVSLMALIIVHAARNRRSVYSFSVIRPNKTSLGLMGASLFALLCVIGGANTLNNNGPNYMTITGLLTITTIIAAVFMRFRQVQSWAYPAIIFCIGLALTLLYSLRSWHILGWDINLEYQVFHLTGALGHWSMSNAPGTEYNACLSITLLPTILHRLIGGDPEYIFKLTMQVIFAVVPVGIFALCRQYVRGIYAFMAAVFYMGQTWYIEQMPALVRQEIAFVFFVGMLLVLFDTKLQRLTRWGLGTLFVAGMVVSHYSTTYVWLAIGLLTVVILGSLKITFPSARRRHFRLLVALPFLTLGLALLWNSVYTQTSNSSQGFVKGALSHTSEVFTADALKGGIERIGFAPPDTDKAGNLEEQYRVIQESYNSSQYNLYSGQEQYLPKPMPDMSYVEPIMTGPLAKIWLLVSKLVKLAFVNIFPLTGLLYTIWLFRSKRPIGADYIAVAAATFPLIFLVLFFPFVQAQYNLTRLFMQIMIILALPTVVGMTLLLRRYDTKFRTLAAGVFATFLLYSMSVTTQVAGGAGAITLNQPASRFDSFYIHDTELQSAYWLQRAAAKEKDPIIYADILGRLRLQGFAKFGDVNVDIFPSTIDQNGYVYLSDINTNKDTAYLFYKNETLPYKYPREFLNQNKDAIYSNGGSMVYK